MTPSGSRGFTVVELLVVAVLGSTIALAAHRVLITNSRAFTAVNQGIRSHQNVRAGMEVLFGELREISPSGGDIGAMDRTSVTIRSVKSFGVVCAADVSGTPKLTVRRHGRWIEAGDSILVLADNDPALASDDVWLTAKVGVVERFTSCSSGDSAQVITLPGMTTAMTADSVRDGAPVRAFQWYWYGLHQLDGEWYLGRGTPNGPPEPLVGPLRSDTAGGVQFEFLDSAGATTTTPADVAQFLVTLRAAESVSSGGSNPVSDSLSTRIHARN